MSDGEVLTSVTNYFVEANKQLRAERDRLREALEKIVDLKRPAGLEDARAIAARAALAKEAGQ